MVAVAQQPPSDDFVQLFTRHQRRVYLYILAQVPNPVEAEEILQETNVVIWNKFQQFQSGTNFFAWAARIASFEVMKYRDRRRRERLCFSSELVAQIAAESLENADHLGRRRQALMQCLSKLSSRDRELVQSRYAPGESGKGLAERVGRPANSVYQSLSRIRRALFECVNRSLAEEANA